MRPYLKKTHHKNRAGGVAQGIGLGFKPHIRKQKTKNKPKPKPTNQTNQNY
jgi:hypothetical protein